MLKYSSITNGYNYNKMSQTLINQKTISANKVNGSLSTNNNKSLASDGHLSSEAYTQIAHSLGYTDYHGSDGTPTTIYTKELGYVSNGYQVLAKFYQNLSREQDKEINEILETKGIQLSPDEKLSFSVGTDYKITVSGTESEEKLGEIEKVLNNPDKNFGSKLFRRCMVINEFNGQLDKQEYDKWEVNNFLQANAGIGLADLKLVDGEVEGANDTLTRMLNSDETGMNEYVLHTYQTMMEKLKSLLSQGVDNIPDLQYSIDYQNGSLIDRDVKYGFGVEQVKAWLPDIEAGHIPVDLKI